jgi:flagellar hook protein FlgE
MSFQQGLSGLNASAKNLQVIGNNIANANTYGAKTARAEFADVYAASLGAPASGQIGLGAKLAAVAQQFSQGNIKTTDNPIDLAINGGGFFQISDPAGAVSYTRNGQFKLDREGYVVNNGLQRLMGYPADATGQIQPGQAVALKLPTSGVAPRATSQIDIEANLDSRKAVTTPSAAPLIDFNDADTYNNATTLTLYDAKGQEVALTYYFQKSADDNWNVFATANGTTLAGTAAAPSPITPIVFAANGSAPTAPTAPVLIDIPAATNSQGVATMAILGIAFDLSKMTQFGSAFGVTDMQQDGYSAGSLNSVTVEANGVITARYSNGQSQPAGQIELSTFRNAQGLTPMGDNAWARTFASGDPVNGAPGQGNLGALEAGALEESNIDLTGELVNMITAQRIYQANAQSIKTEDQILQTMINLR